MSTASTATGSGATKTQASAPSSNTSPTKQSPTTTPKPAAATAVESVTVVSVVEQTDSFIALAPAPTESQQTQPTSTLETPQSTQPTSTKPKPTSESHVQTTPLPTEAAPTVVPVVNTQTTLSTQIQSSSSIASKSASTSSSPSLVPLSNGSPFQGSNDGENAAPKKNTGATIAGVVGGLSAAILLGVLGFFLWKWKTRGKYRFNKRASFGPYGNGIDANRGGLLVSSVACKPADSLSNHEESLYSDENSPTRYDRPSFDLNREPTLPSVGDLPDRSIRSPTSPPKVHFGMDHAIPSSFPGQQSYRPVDPMMAVAGAAPLMSRTSVRQPGGGVLYEPRRPPAPPSMRRNRSPPQPPGSAGAEEGDYLTRGGNPNSMPRSNSLSGQFSNRSLPAPPYGVPPPNGRMQMRQVRRTASMNGMDNSRYGHSANGNGFDPLSMHPVIPEVPSGPTTPVPRDSQNVETVSPSNSITRSPVNMYRPPPPPSSGRSNSTSAPRPPMPDRWSTLTSDSDKPKVLTVRNPSPDREKESSGIGSIVRRVSSLRQDREHTVKPELAAKNF